LAGDGVVFTEAEFVAQRVRFGGDMVKAGEDAQRLKRVGIAPSRNASFRWQDFTLGRLGCRSAD